jgi:hypothetical protein
MLSMLPFATRRVRTELARTGFVDGALAHELVIPAGPGGRPGERLVAPSRSLHPLDIGPDGTRHDFTVLVDRYGSSLKALCLRPASDVLEAERSLDAARQTARVRHRQSARRVERSHRWRGRLSLRGFAVRRPPHGVETDPWRMALCRRLALPCVGQRCGGDRRACERSAGRLVMATDSCGDFVNAA